MKVRGYRSRSNRLRVTFSARCVIITPLSYLLPFLVYPSKDVSTA